VCRCPAGAGGQPSRQRGETKINLEFYLKVFLFLLKKVAIKAKFLLTKMKGGGIKKVKETRLKMIS
jgi:hypothetical protein